VRNNWREMSDKHLKILIVKNQPLQLIRGVACISVFIFHAEAVLDRYFLKRENFLSSLGITGVTLFFVLSSFLITNQILSNKPNFLVNRLLRIYPTYITSVIFIICLKMFIFNSIENENFLKAVTLIPFGNRVTYPLGIEWSLIFEIIFYLIVSLFTFKKIHFLFKFFITLWFICLIFFSVNYGLLYKFPQILIAEYFLPFTLGSFTAIIFQRYLKNRVLVNSSFFIYIFLIVGYCFTFMNHSRFHLSSMLQTIISGCLFSVAVLLGALNKEKKFKNRIMTKIGDNSYVIYLLHLSFLDILGSKLFSTFSISIATQIYVICVLPIFVTSYLFGHFDSKIQAFSRKMVNF